ncbi:MAG: UDP-3-O-acyl-N-acetylglucosamine deacetylase [Candidatus Acidiferrales bacterium]
MSAQTTIREQASADGIGLHTAVLANVTLRPAPADTGIVFRRTDLDGFEVEAHVRNVARVSYATSLMKRGVWLSTIEHLLAALYSCGVDNVYIDIDALEVPILDGSAQPWIDLIEQAGVRRLRRRRRYIKVMKPLEISDGAPGTPAFRSIGIYPAEEFRVRCLIDFPHPMVGRQEITLRVGRATFCEMLARARTFGFYDDIERLRAVGLIRGGSLANAIVLTRDGILNPSAPANSGTANGNGDHPLRYPDEFGRHKTLDLIGDLALVSRPLKALVVAHKAGHALHTQLVTRLLADDSLWTETTEEAGAPAPQPADVSLSAGD